MRTLDLEKVRSVSLRTLLKLERSGQYEKALEAFGPGWREVDHSSPCTRSDEHIDPEIMLRLGILVGYHGHKHQIGGSQERSKDILTALREHFIARVDLARAAEAENHIALSYWRTGEYREAMAWVEEALSHDLPPSEDARLHSYVVRSLVRLGRGEHNQNIAECLEVEADVRRFGDAFLNGSLCTNIGLSYKEVSLRAQAVEYLGLAMEFHQRSGHKCYLATVYNNLAQLYKDEGRFDHAHQHVDSAIKVYRKCRDRVREASSLDTRAQIFLAEGKLEDALAAADRSVKLLKKISSAAELVESLATRAKILESSGQRADALLCLCEAVTLVRTKSGERAARDLVADFLGTSQTNLPPAATKDEDRRASDLELLMPPNLAHYVDYRAVWIHTDRLKGIGIARNSLAVVVPGGVERGSLAALKEKESGLVSCGYYDADFGLICLENDDHDPQIFNEKDVEVLGRIVGVCRSARNDAGKLLVEPLVD